MNFLADGLPDGFDDPDALACMERCAIPPDETPEQERRKNIAEIMWADDSGGYGYGICRVAEMFIDAMSRPDKDHPDWPSVVTVFGPPEKYTDEELRKIVAFSREMTAKYDKMFSYRMGANLHIIDKVEEGRWLRKKKSWYMGPMYSSTLDEAMEVLR